MLGATEDIITTEKSMNKIHKILRSLCAYKTSINQCELELVYNFIKQKIDFEFLKNVTPMMCQERRISASHTPINPKPDVDLKIS